MTAPPLIDTHAHLDDESFAGDVALVVARARDRGVVRIVNIGYCPARWRTTIALAATFPEIDFALGLHPNHAEEESETLWAELRALIIETRPVAIGEIGLDYYRDHASKATQRRVFDRQLDLAADGKLPVIIHQRAAEADVVGFLRQRAGGAPWILHSFDGSPGFAEEALAAGCYLGAGGLMTRAGSNTLRDILRTVPLDRLLLETDSPYLVPRGVKNRRNEPSNLPTVATALAELLERPVEEIAGRTTANAGRALARSSEEPG